MRTDLEFVPERFVIPQVYGNDAEPLGTVFAGFSASERENGWAIAYFTFEQSSRVLEESLRVMRGSAFYRARYAADLDAFVFDDGYHPLEIYPGEHFLTDGTPRKLYNLGGRGNWIWHTASQYEGLQSMSIVKPAKSATYPDKIDWTEVVKRYTGGAEIPGAASIFVTGADDDYIYVKHRLWSDRFSRKHFEKAVGLLSAGKMSRDKSSFIEQYRIFASEERPTTAAWIMKDLGFLT
jgi:hypothetical protein